VGIRVHKSVGYGLTDIEFDEESHKIVDKRVDPEGYLHHSYDVEEEDEDKYPWERDGAKGYKKWIKKNFTKDQRHSSRGPHLDMFSFGHWSKKEIKSWDPFKSVIHQGEFGLPNVLLVVPFGFYKSWNRYDDTLDWCEETHCHEQMNRVVAFKRGIYPFNNVLVDPVSGAPYLGLHHTEEDALVKAGKAVPRVPPEVSALCRYLKLFKDDKTILDLRPMLYVHWG